MRGISKLTFNTFIWFRQITCKGFGLCIVKRYLGAWRWSVSSSACRETRGKLGQTSDLVGNCRLALRCFFSALSYRDGLDSTIAPQGPFNPLRPSSLSFLIYTNQFRAICKVICLDICVTFVCYTSRNTYQNIFHLFM